MVTKKQLATKILLVHPFFHPHIGGSQRYAEELSVAVMRKYPKVRVDVLAYNTDNTASFEVYRGLFIHRVPCLTILPGKFVLPHPVGLICQLWQLRKNRYNFIWTHIRFFDPCWWGWVYARLIGARSIFTGHCAGHPEHSNGFVKSVAKLVDLTLARLSLKFYDQVQVTNQAAGRFAREKLGVKKYHLVYGGVDSKFFAPNKAYPRDVPGEAPTDGKIRVAYIGRIVESKGVRVLYRAAKILLGKTQSLGFVFAGPGELRGWLEREIKRDGLQGKVSLLPALNVGEVRDLLRKTDIFVYPSFYQEGLPNSILEAMAAQTLVIATNQGGVKELIENGKTGLLIPAKDEKALISALERAILHPQQREQIAMNAREFVVKSFDWEQIASRLYRLLSNQSHRLDK